MVDCFYFSHYSNVNNNWQFTLRKVCKDLLSSVSMEDSNFPILLCSLTLVVFYRYMRSQKTEHVNTIKKKMYGTQPIKYEEGGRS